MRKILILISLVALTAGIHAQEEKKKESIKVEASGNIITKEFPVQSFDRLDASGVFSLHLSQDNKEQVKIEADDNLMEYFEVKNEGSLLKISMKKDLNIKGRTKLKVYVSFRKLNSMDLTMVGSTISEEKLSFDELKLNNNSVGSVNLDLNAKTIHMDISSVGSIKLSGTADNAVIKSSGVGSLQAGEFLVQKMKIENSGVGSAEVNVEKELSVTDSFLGKVRNKGNATVRKMNKVVI